MKNIVKEIAVVVVILLIGVAYKMFTGESSGADVAKDVIENFSNGGPIIYSETYISSEVEGVYTFARDVDGNVMISDEGTMVADGSTYNTVDYKIGDTYYASIDGVNYEYGSDELNQFEGYEGFDVQGFFVKEETYVIDTLTNYGVDLFDNDVEAEFKREGDLYVATGTYSEGGDFKVELAKDGSSFKIVDEVATVEITFDSEPIALP